MKIHYSEKLKNEIADREEKIVRAKEMINQLRTHLCSSKFHQDTTIQVSDVHNWLDCVVTELNGEL